MGNSATTWRHRTGEIVLDRTRVMGILNVTPDSFSDGGRYFDAETALRHGLDLVDMGADLVDIGGESTRPGSDPVSAEEEGGRVGPGIRGLAGKGPVPLSIDTMKPAVASNAIEAGAWIVDDVFRVRESPSVRPLRESPAGGVGV